MPTWNHKAYGSLTDPAHKSDTSSLVGQHACTERFRRERNAQLDPTAAPREHIYGRTALGTAAHETIYRALTNPELVARILSRQYCPPPDAIRRVLLDELERATAGLEVVWDGGLVYPPAEPVLDADGLKIVLDEAGNRVANKNGKWKQSADSSKGQTLKTAIDQSKVRTPQQAALDDACAMVRGLLDDLPRYVSEVVLVEAGFIAGVGKHWIEGHVDLVFRPRSAPGTLAYTDWKTGVQKPHPVELYHGFESGFYSAALAHGKFLSRSTVREWQRIARDPVGCFGFEIKDSDREALMTAPDDREAMHAALRMVARSDEHIPGVVEFGEFPSEIWLTHLRDYIPYSRKGSKRVERPEDLSHYGLTEPGDVSYEAGTTRGPAWLPVRRTAEDVSRLERRLRSVVGLVRMGMFVDSVGEKCTRCPFRADCLSSGYELRGDDAKALAASLRGLDLADSAFDLGDVIMAAKKTKKQEEYVIVRCRDAGVHAGVLAGQTREHLTLISARRVWYWTGAASISEIAVRGLNQRESKIAVNVPRIQLRQSDICEVILCTTEGRASIVESPEWRA